jgi:GNAT superfamily N-acetyltransferase
MSDEPILREATLADAATLVQHRRLMFEDIWKARGQEVDVAQLDKMDAVYREHLCAHLGDGTLKAWVVELNGLVVASGAITYLVWPPLPNDLTQCVPYLHSVYTAAAHRRRGFAHRVVQAAINDCRQRGLKRLTLHASEAGQPIYASLGFQATNEMRLLL